MTSADKQPETERHRKSLQTGPDRPQSSESLSTTRARLPRTASRRMTTALLSLAERRLLPDCFIRAGIRRLLHRRLTQLNHRSPEAAADELREFLAQARGGPIAVLPEKANEQHYELPPEFFQYVLGTHRKYSCGYFAGDAVGLAAAEAEALRRTSEHAGLADGQHILELGCGWGSLSLWMAERFPRSQIHANSNSRSQREYITAETLRRGLSNLIVETCDISRFQTNRRYDRVVSVEMFEHVRNHALLMERIAGWLRPDGRLLVHIFCHRQHTYPFEDTNSSSWMARHFFSGGIMPGHDLLLRAQGPLRLIDQWNWDGRQYQKTADAWLSNMDSAGPDLNRVLQSAYGDAWPLWKQRWRIFFLACSELFGYRHGTEWFVAHYLFSP